MAQNMKLFAAGFNAWNQLSFDRPHNPDDDDEPHDLAAFTDVLQGRYLGLPTSKLSYTIGMHIHTYIHTYYQIPAVSSSPC